MYSIESCAIIGSTNNFAFKSEIRSPQMPVNCYYSVCQQHFSGEEHDQSFHYFASYHLDRIRMVQKCIKHEAAHILSYAVPDVIHCPDGSTATHRTTPVWPLYTWKAHDTLKWSHLNFGGKLGRESVRRCTFHSLLLIEAYKFITKDFIPCALNRV